MFIHFYTYEVLIYILNYNKDSLIIKAHIKFFVYMNDNMYDEFFCAYKYYTLIWK
jgi:hypothetical protein